MSFLITMKDVVIDNSIFFAPFFGIIPALIWLWFWLKEDIHPEPNKFIIFSFLCGMLAVLITLPIQKLVHNTLFENQNGNFYESTFILFLLWAAIEEILKFFGAWIGGIHSKADDEPIDPVIYMIVTALGFVALENTLFLIDPLNSGNLTETFITGNLRFIGATLLHVMSSATIGIFLSIGFYRNKLWKRIYGFMGIITAIILHTAFNLFIINGTGGNIFWTFGIVWIALIGLMLLFEKIKNTTVPVQTKF